MRRGVPAGSSNSTTALAQRLYGSYFSFVFLRGAFFSSFFDGKHFSLTNKGGNRKGKSPTVLELQSHCI